jgi:hypothetical protein
MALEEPKHTDIVNTVNGIQVAVENSIVTHTSNWIIDCDSTNSRLIFRIRLGEIGKNI